MKKRIAAVLALTALVALGGLGLVASERLNVVVFRHRPHVLKFGPAQALGACRVRETADPSSDVLSNLVDVDGDGRSEFRTVGFIDGSQATCERRTFLGFWSEAPLETCWSAAKSCAP